MGCSNSKVSDDQEQRGPRPAEPEKPLVIPTVEWKTISSWETFSQTPEPQGEEEGENSDQAQFKRAYGWLAKEYPECHREGTIEKLKEITIPTSYGPCKYNSINIMTLDGAYTGVVLAGMIVLAVPTENGQDGPAPGAMLDTPEMEAAKAAILKFMAILVQSNVNMDHAEAYVVIGADMLRAKFKLEPQQPTITILPEQNAAKIAAIMEKAAKQYSKVRGAKEFMRGVWMADTLRNVIDLLSKSERNAGCTTWDGGELPFSVNGVPYPEPTRILIARRFQNTQEEVDAMHYRVLTPRTTAEDTPVTLVRSKSPDDHMTGINQVNLFVGISKDVIWPRPNQFAGKPAMKAAVVALLNHLKKLNEAGQLQRCIVEVEMGADRLRLSFVGDRFEPAVPDAEKTGDTVAKRPFTDLDAFDIKLEEQQKHELWQSESQFRAVKQMLREKAKQNPERFNARAAMVAQMTAQHFLESNYPGCEVCDEGEIPVTMDGNTCRLQDTRLVIAKAAGKSDKNIIAVILCVPLPGNVSWVEASERKWLGTKEMQAAQIPLLDILKQWFKEGKIADDCMAQIMMGVDSEIWKFVDGERLEDYDDERMKQFK